MDNELEVVEGMKLARGYISPYFITDSKTRKCVSKDNNTLTSLSSLMHFILFTGEDDELFWMSSNNPIYVLMVG